jgi:TRAP-type C4-dicarboxylate transport system permease small subunit
MLAKYSLSKHQGVATGLSFLLLTLLYGLDFLQIQNTDSRSLIFLEALVITAPFLAGAVAQHLKQAIVFLFVLIIGKLTLDYLIFAVKLETFYSDIPVVLSDWVPIAVLRLVLPVFFALMGLITYAVLTKLFKRP